MDSTSAILYLSLPHSPSHRNDPVPAGQLAHLLQFVLHLSQLSVGVGELPVELGRLVFELVLRRVGRAQLLLQPLSAQS